MDAARAIRLLLVPWRVIRRQEAVVLIAVLVAVLAVWGFVEVADEVVEGDAHAFDHRTLEFFRRADDPSTPVGPRWISVAAGEITALGSTAVLTLVLLAAVGYLALRRQYHAMWYVLAATLGGQLLSTALKYGFGRDRPDIVPHLTHFAMPSFPSGHSMLSAVVYLTLGAMLARLETRRRVKAYFIGLALTLTFLVGFTRVYLGVHYPTDVLAGWAAGLTWATLCWIGARYLQQRGTIEAPGSGEGQDHSDPAQ